MDVKLHLVKGNPKGKQVDVPAGTLAVGRAEDSDLIIASTRVSRNHCEFVNDGKTLVLRDKGSANGTFVNKRRITQQTLKPGDQVSIGPLTFAVEIDGKRAAPPAPPAPAAAARPAPAKPAPAKPAPAKPAPAKPAPPKPKAPPAGPRKGPDDILSSLERLAEKRKPGEGKPAADDDVLRISDEDLLEDD